MRGFGPDNVSVASPLGFNCWISFAVVFIYIYCRVLIFVLSPLNLDLFVLGDDTSINKGSFTQTKRLCVLICIRNKLQLNAKMLI